MTHRSCWTTAGLLLAAAGLRLFAQAPATTPADPLLQDLRWRNIGPANLSGRIVDVEALDSDYRFVLAASASGGVWKSVNAGTTWKPIFDRYGSGSIGDVAIFQKDPQILWIGTGEANNRNSVGWGDGVYKSTDGGENFVNVGLRDTFQIARVVAHPSDPGVVYVAAIGNLWGAAGQRGLFKTADGGATWRKLLGGLPDDGKTGATDLVMDPADPNVLYVAFYERLRRPYRFDSGGPNGGIFKSTDAGLTWKKLANGLPAGDTGRIGLAVYRKNPRILLALIEHGTNPPASDPAYQDMSKLGTGVYRSEDGGSSWKFLNRYNNRPFYYSQIRINPLNDQDIYVLTTSLRLSNDGGRTFRPAGPAFGGNYDYHAMWLDPQQHDRFYLGKDKGLTLTHDHGDAFLYYENLPVGQYYAIGVDMRDPYYIYGGTQDNGSWGGPGFARDALGIRNDKNWKLHWGDGMHALVDPTDWRKVYSSAENGSVRRYDPLTYTEELRRPTPRSVFNYEEATGRKRPTEEVMRRSAARSSGGGEGGAARTAAAGAAAESEALFRFNWQSPMIMSPHNPGILYLGGNCLFKTIDGGRSWQSISPDLSNNDPETTRRDSGGLTPDVTGAETYATIVSLSESPLLPGLIWVGTDDGNVQLTRNGGATWTQVGEAIPGVPPRLWVSDVEASYRDPAVAYVAFDGHRSDNFETWVFKTTDYGRSWTSIAADLPKRQPVHVLTADRVNPDLLFVGTEFGCHMTLDGGAHWRPLMNGMPTVAVHDLVIHPRDHDLIAATHGRGLFILDDITPLQQLTPATLSSEGQLFAQRTATWWEDNSRGGQTGNNTWAGENPPSVRPSSTALDRARIVNTPVVTWYLGPQASGQIELQIRNLGGDLARTLRLPARPGINRYAWDGRFELPAGTAAQASGRGGRFGAQPFATAGPGSYLLTLKAGERTYSGVLTIRPDPLLSGR